MSESSELASQLLAESLEEHAAYWSSLPALTTAQERWKTFELELRKNMAGEKPATWLVEEIRSGRWEQRQRRIKRNMLINRSRLWRLRREGYSFDVEHRLVAPSPLPTYVRRERSRERRPSASRRTRSPRGSPRRDDDDEPPPDLNVIPLSRFRRDVEREFGNDAA